jgi:hypothetical protein
MVAAHNGYRNDLNAATHLLYVQAEQQMDHTQKKSLSQFCKASLHASVTSGLALQEFSINP